MGRRADPIDVRSAGGRWDITVQFTTKDGRTYEPRTFDVAGSWLRNSAPRDVGEWLKNLTRAELERLLA